MLARIASGGSVPIKGHVNTSHTHAPSDCTNSHKDTFERKEHVDLYASSGGVSHTSEHLKSSLPGLHHTVLVCPSYALGLPHPSVPVRLPPAGARNACPWHGTAQWQLTTQHAPAPAGLSWCTEYRGRGGSAPGAGACPTPRPGPGPDGSGFQRARPLGDRDARGPRRGAVGRRPRGPAPYGPGRTPGRAAPGCMPRSDGQPADTLRRPDYP